MLIALVNNQRTPAAPTLKGSCQACQQPVTAKCGDLRAWHWAHHSKQDCDSWWEETEWHRNWKSHFPFEWQEVIKYNQQSGEKHIADIYTTHGLTIEFQHSPLHPQERTIRESFYENMIWIVDAAHRKSDYKRFSKAFPDFKRTPQKGMYLVPLPEECFPANWLQSMKPVFFDFKGLPLSTSTQPLASLDTLDPPEHRRELLWCLLPGRTERYAVVIALNRTDIIGEALNNSDMVEVLKKGQELAGIYLQQSRQNTVMSTPFNYRPPPRRRW